MIQSKPVQKGGLKQWIKARRFVILGSLYVLFNILISYVYIKSAFDYRNEEFHPSPEDMSGIFLWIFGAPISLVIYIIYAKCVKENPKPAKYFLILPGFLWIVTLILYLIYQQSYLQLLGYYFTIHLIIGGILFLYFRLPKE